MDLDMRNKLIEKVYGISNPNDAGLPSPVVSLEDFFTGNDDLGSIGCNLDEHPGIFFFYDLLKVIRDKKIEVQDVLVEIFGIQDDDETMWPYSERVYIISSASVGDIENWVDLLEPDEVYEGWANGEPVNAPKIKKGFKVYNVWWD